MICSNCDYEYDWDEDICCPSCGNHEDDTMKMSRIVSDLDHDYRFEETCESRVKWRDCKDVKRIISGEDLNEKIERAKNSAVQHFKYYSEEIQEIKKAAFNEGMAQGLKASSTNDNSGSKAKTCRNW